MTLYHYLGKILFKFGEPNWAVVGDTFPVGCKYQKSIIYYNSLKKNPDYHNSKYNSKYGIYSKNCGIQNIKLSFGHDEYLYLILKNNTNHNLSEKYINIIRFHSFYPWHTGKDYHYFMNDKDIIFRNYFKSIHLYLTEYAIKNPKIKIIFNKRFFIINNIFHLYETHFIFHFHNFWF